MSWLAAAGTAAAGRGRRADGAELARTSLILLYDGRMLQRLSSSPLRAVAAAAVAIGAAAALAACGGSSANGGSATVVATTTQLGDVVRQVAGDAVHVTQILQPNSDPHDYEPRPSDVTATANAKVVFENGDNLDHWMAKVVQQSGGSPTIVTLADTNVVRLPGQSSGSEQSQYDPHWWHDPRNVEAAIPAIRDALTQAYPSARATFAANAGVYLAKVRALDAGIAKCFAAVPAAQRKLVTDHDAFDYFAKRYGITVVGAVIPSQTTQAQPSAGDLAALVRVIRSEHVKAVYPESSVSPKLAQAIARETGATSDLTLYGDTLGPKGSDGATYLAMEQHNADAIVRGFTGDAHGCAIAGIG